MTIKLENEKKVVTTTGKRVQQLIKEYGLSYEKINEDTGLSKSVITKVIYKPVLGGNIDTYMRLSEYFNVSCDYLLGLTDEKSIDVELKDISKKLGLSVDSIENIIYTKEFFEKTNQKHIFNEINLLFENPIFRRFIENIHTYFSYAIIDDGEVFNVTRVEETTLKKLPLISKDNLEDSTIKDIKNDIDYIRKYSPYYLDKLDQDIKGFENYLKILKSKEQTNEIKKDIEWYEIEIKNLKREKEFYSNLNNNKENIRRSDKDISMGLY